jgi:hypothetical protein
MLFFEAGRYEMWDTGRLYYVQLTCKIRVFSPNIRGWKRGRVTESTGLSIAPLGS